MMSCYLEISLRLPDTNLRPLAEMQYVAYVTYFALSSLGTLLSRGFCHGVAYPWVVN